MVAHFVNLLPKMTINGTTIRPSKSLKSLICPGPASDDEHVLFPLFLPPTSEFVNVHLKLCPSTISNVTLVGVSAEGFPLQRISGKIPGGGISSTVYIPGGSVQEIISVLSKKKVSISPQPSGKPVPRNSKSIPPGGLDSFSIRRKPEGLPQMPPRHKIRPLGTVFGRFFGRLLQRYHPRLHSP